MKYLSANWQRHMADLPCRPKILDDAFRLFISRGDATRRDATDVSADETLIALCACRDGKFPSPRWKTFLPRMPGEVETARRGGAGGQQEKCQKGALAPVHIALYVCTLTKARPIIIAAQTLKRCSINCKWLSPNFYFRLELCAIYHSERYEGGALGHAGRWYYSAIT